MIEAGPSGPSPIEAQRFQYVPEGQNLVDSMTLVGTVEGAVTTIESLDQSTTDAMVVQGQPNPEAGGLLGMEMVAEEVGDVAVKQEVEVVSSSSAQELEGSHETDKESAAVRIMKDKNGELVGATDLPAELLVTHESGSNEFSPAGLDAYLERTGQDSASFTAVAKSPGGKMEFADGYKFDVKRLSNGDVVYTHRKTRFGANPESALEKRIKAEEAEPGKRPEDGESLESEMFYSRNADSKIRQTEQGLELANRERMQALGFQFEKDESGRDVVWIPTPDTFVRNIAKQGIKIQIVDGKASPEEFFAVFAEGANPIAGGTAGAEYYEHDVAQEHLQAQIAAAEPQPEGSEGLVPSKLQSMQQVIAKKVIEQNAVYKSAPDGFHWTAWMDRITGLEAGLAGELEDMLAVQPPKVPRTGFSKNMEAAAKALGVEKEIAQIIDDNADTTGENLGELLRGQVGKWAKQIS